MNLPHSIITTQPFIRILRQLNANSSTSLSFPTFTRNLTTTNHPAAITQIRPPQRDQIWNLFMNLESKFIEPMILINSVLDVRFFQSNLEKICLLCYFKFVLKEIYNEKIIEGFFWRFWKIVGTTYLV